MRPTFLILLAAVSLPALAWADKFDLGARGELELEVPTTWTAAGEGVAEQVYNVKIKPKSTANVAVMVTAIFIKDKQAVSEEEMQKRFGEGLMQMVPGSVEKKAEMKTLKLKTGSAFYTSLTDESLVGKPSEPGNFKVMTSGGAKLSDEVMISFTLFSDDKTGADFNEGLKIVESMKLNKK